MKLDEFALEGLKVKMSLALESMKVDETVEGKILPMRRQDFWLEVERAAEEDMDGNLETALVETFKLWTLALLFADPLMLQIDQLILRELASDEDFGKSLQEAVLGRKA